MIVLCSVFVSVLALAAAATTFNLSNVSQSFAFISCAACMISLGAMGVNLAILSVLNRKEIESQGRTVVLPDGTVIVGEKPAPQKEDLKLQELPSSDDEESEEEEESEED
jgi:hypothetical protein